MDFLGSAAEAAAFRYHRHRGTNMPQTHFDPLALPLIPWQKSAREGQTRPKRPKTAKEGRKTAQGGLKRPQRMPHGSPGHAQDGPNEAHEGYSEVKTVSHMTVFLLLLLLLLLLPLLSRLHQIASNLIVSDPFIQTPPPPPPPPYLTPASAARVPRRLRLRSRQQLARGLQAPVTGNLK